MVYYKGVIYPFKKQIDENNFLILSINILHV